MIPTSGINDASDYAPGWLGEYCKLFGENKFPPSYHLLAGMFALSVAIGRRGAVQRGPITLWPPQSVVLLGPSAIGKSQSLYLAGRLLHAFALDPWENDAGQYELMPGFSLSEQGFTPRGLMEEWYRVQQQQGVAQLEGCHIETEMAKVVNPKKKGSEDVNTWIITALEHRDLRDLTGMYGKRHIKNITVAFAFASTLQYLRKALDADEFAGGLMHRFLIVYEREGRVVQESRKPDEIGVQRLAERLRALRHSTPPSLELPTKVKGYFDRLDRQPKYFKHHQLAGFWGRFADLSLKTAQLYALAQGSTTITMEDAERAETFMRYRLAPTLAGIVEELDAEAPYKKLLDLHDSLETAGPSGMSVKELLRRMGKLEQKDSQAMLDSMVTVGLAHKRGAHVWARASWATVEEEE